MNDHTTDLANTEAPLNTAMDHVVGNYATRVAFAWDRLASTMAATA